MAKYEIVSKNIKCLGMKVRIFQICLGNDVVKVAYSQAEAEAWVATNPVKPLY